MSICYIYQDQYPWDIRVEKVVESLARRGHEVHIVSKNRSGLPRQERISEGVFVDRLPAGLEGYSRWLINFPAFFSPFWLAAILSTIKKNRSRVIIVRDLPLGPTALLAGRITGVPVIMDMAENYPAMIQSTWKYRGPRLADYLARNPYLLRKMEEWLLPRLDGVMVVSEASMERVRAIMNKRARPVWVVGNTPRLELSSRLYSIPLVERMTNHKGVVLLYTGMVEAHRGLDVVIKAIPQVLKEGVNLLFVMVGSGSQEGRLQSLSEELNVAGNVLFAGWVDSLHIPSVIAASDICIVPHYVTEHTDTTIPNKIYDYMAQKKPVIVTHSKTLTSIVDSTGCGRSYRDDSPVELAKAVIEMKADSFRARLGEAGYKAVMERFNWAEDEKVLFSAIDHFLKKN